MSNRKSNSTNPQDQGYGSPSNTGWLMDNSREPRTIPHRASAMELSRTQNRGGEHRLRTTVSNYTLSSNAQPPMYGESSRYPAHAATSWPDAGHINQEAGSGTNLWTPSTGILQPSRPVSAFNSGRAVTVVPGHGHTSLPIGVGLVNYTRGQHYEPYAGARRDQTIDASSPRASIHRIAPPALYHAVSTSNMQARQRPGLLNTIGQPSISFPVADEQPDLPQRPAAAHRRLRRSQSSLSPPLAPLAEAMEPAQPYVHLGGSSSSGTNSAGPTNQPPSLIPGPTLRVRGSSSQHFVRRSGTENRPLRQLLRIDTTAHHADGSRPVISGVSPMSHGCGGLVIGANNTYSPESAAPGSQSATSPAVASSSTSSQRSPEPANSGNGEGANTRLWSQHYPARNLRRPSSESVQSGRPSLRRMESHVRSPLSEAPLNESQDENVPLAVLREQLMSRQSEASLAAGRSQDPPRGTDDEDLPLSIYRERLDSKQLRRHRSNGSIDETIDYGSLFSRGSIANSISCTTTLSSSIHQPRPLRHMKWHPSTLDLIASVEQALVVSNPSANTPESEEGSVQPDVSSYGGSPTMPPSHNAPSYPMGLSIGIVPDSSPSEAASSLRRVESPISLYEDAVQHIITPCGLSDHSASCLEPVWHTQRVRRCLISAKVEDRIAEIETYTSFFIQRIMFSGPLTEYVDVLRCMKGVKNLRGWIADLEKKEKCCSFHLESALKGLLGDLIEMEGEVREAKARRWATLVDREEETHLAQLGIVKNASEGRVVSIPAGNVRPQGERDAEILMATMRGIDAPDYGFF